MLPYQHIVHHETHVLEGKRNFPRRLLLAVLLASAATLAQAADPIEGHWQTEDAATAEIAPCGDAFCVTLIDGDYPGKRIGKLTGSGNEYSGQITDPRNDKTYTGYATVIGKYLKLKGCVLGVLCQSQTWKRL